MYTRYWWWRMSSTVALWLGTWTHVAAADGQDWGPWGMHMMWGSWGIGMMFMMFLFWAAIIVAIVFFIRWLITAGDHRHQAVTGHDTESALDILKKRYARGEISKAEFQDMRQDLQERD
jgi:putative membrane protein